MRFIIAFALVLFVNQLMSQEINFDDYLTNNRTDLRQNNVYLNQKIIGFTVMHGSSKAEDAELALIKSQLEKVDTLIYIPEIDAAMGYYFNLYLRNGDENLLKDLILTYQKYVPQEASVAMYNKWKELRELSKDKHIVVYGLDRVATYKYFVKQLLELINKDETAYSQLSGFWNNRQTDYSINNETPLKQCLREIVLEYQNQSKTFDNYPTLSYLFENIEDTFKEKKTVRDSVMYRNYTNMKRSFGTSKQFIRMGLGHMTKLRFMKQRPSFIARLIEQKACKPTDIYSTIGLLHNSKVLLTPMFNEEGKYESFSQTGEDFYTGEGFLPGVKLLENNKLSDITFFDLSKEKSPSKQVRGTVYSGFELLPNTSWADYFDGAILIDSSEANVPIESIY